MTIKNLTKDQIIHKDVLIAKKLWDKGLGLIIRDQPMFFKTRFGIHTLFVRKPIDVIILDSDLKVKKIKHNLKPNRFFFWKIAYPNCLEFPHGTLDIDQIDVGDQLVFVS